MIPRGPPDNERIYGMLCRAFHSHKPTIAQLHGAAEQEEWHCPFLRSRDNGRGSSHWITLQAGFGGCPTTAIWTYRIGPERAKRMLFTGDLINGKEAEAMGLVLKAVPENQLEETVRLLVGRIKTVPKISSGCRNGW